MQEALLEILRELRALDARLAIYGERLIVNAPTGSLPQPLRTAIAAHKTELIGFLRSAPSQLGLSLRPREGNGDARLSFSQERMWFVHQLLPDAAAYNMSSATTVTGPWDKVAFLSALGSVVTRHDMLRTTFAAPEGDPRQRVARELESLPVAEHDCTHLPAHEREEAAQSLAAEYTMRPFDLEHGPLWRVLIVRTDHDRHLVAIVMHHIIGDLWSFG